MSRTPVRIYKPSKAEEKALVERLAARCGRGLPNTGGHCEACDKTLESGEEGLRGYASGYLLGLCRKCASFVNTEQAIREAIVAGALPKANAVYSPAKSSYDAGAGYNKPTIDGDDA